MKKVCVLKFSLLVRMNRDIAKYNIFEQITVKFSKMICNYVVMNYLGKMLNIGRRDTLDFYSLISYLPYNSSFLT